MPWNKISNTVTIRSGLVAQPVEQIRRYWVQIPFWPVLHCACVDPFPFLGLTDEIIWEFLSTATYPKVKETIT